MRELQLLANEPLSARGFLYARDFIDDITDNHEGYTHTISALGGFDTANFTLKGNKDYLDDWFNDGIMRRILLINPEGLISWEGFVSQMRYNIGTLVKTKSIDDMYNRIHMRYAPLNTSVSPPVAGEPTDIILNDFESQTNYGVKTAIVSGGERSENKAFDWARTLLKENKDIQIGESVNTLSTESLSIQISCKGYYHTLKWLPYISGTSGKIQSGEVIIEILEYFNQFNQGWLSLNFNDIFYNFAKSKREYNNLQTCWDVIKEIIDFGGLGGERWVGGFYQDRKFIYKNAEDKESLYGIESDLYRYLSDPRQLIYDSFTNNEIKPWDMVPDRILKTIDIGGPENEMYIEQITYRAPYGLQLIGGNDQRLSVFLKQKGLPGT